MRNFIEETKFVNFVRKTLNLTKLEIIVVCLAYIEILLINQVIVMSHRNKAILYQLYFTILVIMFVIYSSKTI